MRHLGLSKITDFVRGCVGPEEREAIVRHLADCGKCQAAADLFAKVVVAAVDESLYTPPAADVHCAKALFSLQRLAAVELWSGSKGRLLFDSFTQPEPGGVRGSRRSSRQTVFAADGVSVDLSQHVLDDTLQVRLTGQVLSNDGGGAPLAGVRVSLMGGRDVVAERTTNAFGEFDMQYAPKPSLRLVIAQVGVSETAPSKS